jgi:catechol 2,3-dioxygenase-like lactoylglutathione lyase family enzyme
MTRFHVHLAVDRLADNIRFYSALFGSEPAVVKPDYAKWMLDDPRINFAISERGAKPGLDHLGIQVESDAELKQLGARLNAAALPVEEQSQAGCCYAVSDKYWTIDPQGVAWESFHTLDAIPTFGNATENPVRETQSACCAPAPAGGCCA